MTEVKRYHVGDTGLVEGESLGRITVVLVADFDRVEAERDELQQRLTVSDQENDNLKTEIRVVKQSLNSLKGECVDLRYSKEKCQFPQSCTTRCDCDIPDFSPGSGNKARRRVQAIEALKPENQRIVPLPAEPTTYDGFDNGSD
ncbi:hypothetical protein [Pseudomonas fluorescens]|uniref:hypothetical protein n=1 Tax=Pseudomonas fluorescens TaxID=294 RepID=UPI001CA6C045|nr:hypothetical protein [Pseudomonas fluorescens]MBY8934255.1 hypothetical protein [Pseudomonas fluorescens]